MLYYENNWQLSPKLHWNSMAVWPTLHPLQLRRSLSEYISPSSKASLGFSDNDWCKSGKPVVMPAWPERDQKQWRLSIPPLLLGPSTPVLPCPTHKCTSLRPVTLSHPMPPNTTLPVPVGAGMGCSDAMPVLPCHAVP